MACPFAKFASSFHLTPTKGTDFHAHHHPPAPTSVAPSTLSEALRLGTVASHRAVEKSRGVSLLLHTPSSSSSSAAGDDGLTFGRIDYVRFSIMLCCVYAVMEASLVRARGSVEALFEGGLMHELARTQVLVDDVRAHLETLEVHSGAGLADLAEQARDDVATSGEADDPQSRNRLLEVVQEALPLAAQLGAETSLSEDHIALLTPSQVSATLAYVARLHHLATTTPTLLIAHAYTRYLGDLSGGQHIVRKVSKRFPTTLPPNGFRFYHFTAPDLKPRFKRAMDHYTPSALLVQEANTAFDLNTGLFESLLPLNLRMPLEQHLVRVKQSAPRERWRVDALLAALLVGVSLVFVLNYMGSTRHFSVRI